MQKPKQLKPKRPLLLVEWDDASGGANWRDEKNDYTDGLVRSWTVGWKLKSNRKTLVLASSRQEYGDCSDRSIIPQSSVRRIRRLE